MFSDSIFLYSSLAYVCQRYLNFYEKNENLRVVKPDGIFIKVSDQKFIAIFKEEYLKLISRDKKIIKFEFIEKKKGWWKEFFSRSYFYRCKKDCSIKFLESLIKRNAIFVKS